MTSMNGRQPTMYERLNITLPERTVRLLDRVAKRGDRSRLIAAAIERYVEEVGRAQLRKQLKEGALRRGDRDRAIAQAFFNLEEEVWPGGRR